MIHVHFQYSNIPTSNVIAVESRLARWFSPTADHRATCNLALMHQGSVPKLHFGSSTRYCAIRNIALMDVALFEILLYLQ